MVDPVLSRATQQVAEQSVQQGASSGAGQSAPNAADTAKFENAMNGQSSNVQAAQSTTAAQNAQATAAADQPRSIGDAILDSLDNVRNRHDMHMENIQDKLMSPEGGELTVQDAMALQFEVMQMGMEHELTTKIADKTSQGVQTLFHNQ